MFHYLLSYHYYRDTDLDRLAEAAGNPALTFLADSGAFSAEHAGASVDVSSYAAWLRRWEHRIHAYASLDVLHDPDASARNLDALRALGLDPVPVFHVGSPLEVYEQLVETNSYVAVGGMVRASVTMRDPRLARYLGRLHAIAGERGTRLHGFGLSSWPMIRRFPWYSVDSSAPGSGYRYGRVMAFDPFADKWVTWGLRDKRAWHRHGWLVREYGMTPADFRSPVNREVRAALIAIAARSWSRAASTLVSTRFYLVDTATSAMKGGPAHGDVQAQWENGNGWDTRVYVTDAALDQVEHGGTRMRAYEAGNSWDTTLYLSDPHPSAGKNVERIQAWAAGNAWGTAP